MVNRNRTLSEYVGYGLHLYFSGLSLRRTPERLPCFVKRNHVSVWNWIQKCHPQKISSKRKRVAEFIVDEMTIKAGSEYVWLWVAIESKYRAILTLNVSKKRNTFVAERFVAGLVKTNEKHEVSTDGGTWYSQACMFLRLNHHKTPILHSCSSNQK